jgi:hypothetical protein
MGGTSIRLDPQACNRVKAQPALGANPASGAHSGGHVGNAQLDGQMPLDYVQVLRSTPTVMIE